MKYPNIEAMETVALGEASRDCNMELTTARAVGLAISDFGPARRYWLRVVEMPNGSFGYWIDGHRNREITRDEAKHFITLNL